MTETRAYVLGRSREEASTPEEELVGSPLDRLQLHFIGLYDRRNTVYLPDRVSRINFLNVAIGDLQDATRKGATKEQMEPLLARTVSRTFCIANGINDVSVGHAMSEKYPSVCAYCLQNPCVCEERRQDPTLGLATLPQQREWSLKEWQEHLNSLYGAKNKEKGIDQITSRLFKEVAELMNIEYGIFRLPMTMDEVEDEYSLELADGLAWTIAVANYYDVDLEAVVVEKYGRGCVKCQQNPCICAVHSFVPVRSQGKGKEGN